MHLACSTIAYAAIQEMSKENRTIKCSFSWIDTQNRRLTMLKRNGIAWHEEIISLSNDFFFVCVSLYKTKTTLIDSNQETLLTNNHIPCNVKHLQMDVNVLTVVFFFFIWWCHMLIIVSLFFNRWCTRVKLPSCIFS